MTPTKSWSMIGMEKSKWPCLKLDLTNTDFKEGEDTGLGSALETVGSRKEHDMRMRPR